MIPVPHKFVVFPYFPTFLIFFLHQTCDCFCKLAETNILSEVWILNISNFHAKENDNLRNWCTYGLCKMALNHPSLLAGENWQSVSRYKSKNQDGMVHLAHWPILKFEYKKYPHYNIWRTLNTQEKRVFLSWNISDYMLPSVHKIVIYLN